MTKMCCYCHYVKEGKTFLVIDQEYRYYHCQRFPPPKHSINHSPRLGERIYWADFPIVAPDDWCGEFKEKR